MARSVWTRSESPVLETAFPHRAQRSHRESQENRAVGPSERQARRGAERREEELRDKKKESKKKIKGGQILRKGKDKRQIEGKRKESEMKAREVRDI